MGNFDEQPWGIPPSGVTAARHFPAVDQAITKALDVLTAANRPYGLALWAAHPSASDSPLAQIGTLTTHLEAARSELSRLTDLAG